MKRNLLYGILFAAVALFSMTGCAEQPTIDLKACDSFVAAKPVWAEGRETERNLTLSFREVVKSSFTKSAYIRLTASCDYRLSINGVMVAHGPSVAAHDFYRVDCIDLKPYLKRGDNVVAIEVAGYNDDSYYLLNQPSFLQAEVELNGEVVAATGEQFTAYDMQQRKQDVPEFSFQRPHTEFYTLTANYNEWAKCPEWQANVEPVKLVEQPTKTLLSRHVEYPDYTIHDAVLGENDIYAFKCNSSGFLGMEIKVEEAATVKLYFDEILNNGKVDPQRLGTHACVTYTLEAGNYSLESFEPYTMKYVHPVIEGGKCAITRIYMRDYCNSDVARATFLSDNGELNRLFETARETFRQNALDVFMDCPSRERAGWLCDSYFTSRVAFDLSGDTQIERNFIQNFLLPEKFKHIDEGMLPMCYPSDHPNQNHIPNWAMWFVVELEEYLHRSGDREMVDAAKNRVYALIDYFKPFLNEDGLLEKLTRWVFVEWSRANSLVQDVSYPSNMLYAYMLDVAGRLYDDTALHEQAEKVREAIRKQSFDGEYFVDNAIRGKGGKLALSGEHTEACQYYAFYTNTATPESHPELWKRLRDEFGPKRKETNAYADVPFANAFIGNYLRNELLSREGLSSQILDETVDFYLPMANLTGTLWENMTTVASCNHGFASHIAHVLYRDVLGVYDISPTEKKVTLRLIDSGLSKCQGSIPVGDESVDVEWTMQDGEFAVSISLPEGYTYETIPTFAKVSVIQK
ncbi:MAG: hypothetical protein IKY82_02685 [Alistipes sp.]|nr:hypothetical protein [Alistipes sp.]